jgi:hypothetical protein
VRLPPFAEHPAWGPAPPSRAGVPRAPEPRRGKGLASGRRGREGGKVPVPRSNAGTSPRVVLSLGGGDEGRALAVGSTRCRSAAFDRARGRRKPWRGRGGDRASTRGNGCGGGPRTPCGARTRYRYAVARKARTGLPWVSSPGGLGADGGEGLGLSPTGSGPPRKGSVGISGAWSPERMARAKRIQGWGGDSSPGSRRPSRLLPASREGAVRPTGPATAVPRLGNGARCPGKSPGRPPAKQGRSPTASCGRSRGRRPKGPAGPQAVESPGLRDALIPKGPPLLPPAHRRGVSALWGATFAKCAFVQG